ncbi:MAG TPA: RNA polymerase sigma factor RpoD/SigA [Candidatus Obscuribacter sp.]|nr:RNA polymerase sigma factor RpoD/SigA [Candidatus Obscuribacter sp.]MBK9282520.1 RNA polymerase sigma factor RpoD/SigA [Candidatus Obscuribacter sp.]HMW89412.1 RNA polymerase sigma factor RpoD/SigA [Candidatus Obscuribacter sp.]HMX44374.1 RNA polymerase sigma factor RpoD/SigA [Candidatus Obscuribacter sp.]HMY52325.1 RNA polymerase sigma factor RpoD/SigA [Candidatus Obscuribacter sp.]
MTDELSFDDEKISLFSMYMQEARKIPLITAEEEASLAFRARNVGKAAAEARTALIEANLRLVVSVAWRYVRPGIELEDLVQEGNIGLMKAISRFDPSKGFRLSTYALWWIRLAIKRYIANYGRQIRLPVHKVRKAYQLHQALDTLRRHGPEPTLAELAAFLNLTVKSTGDLLRQMALPVSLQEPTSQAGQEDGDDERELLDTIAADQSWEPSQKAETDDIAVALNAAMAKLNERETLILKHRFGLGEADFLTLEEIGDMFSITRERVRQIESAALRKLGRGEKGAALRQLL